MFTPTTILKLWKRVNSRFGLAEDDPKAKGKEKKPSPKAKQAEKEDTRITKSLTALRGLGKGNLTEPGPAKQFLKSRDKAAKVMKKYCKLLKGNDLKEVVQDLTKFRKAIKQLTVVVEALEAKPYPEEAEGGEPDLNALDKVDTSALDKAMDDPKFGEYSDAELDQEEAEAESAEDGPTAKEGEPVPVAPTKSKPTEDLAAKFKQRLQELMPRYQKVVPTGPTNKPQMELAMKLAMAAGKNLEFDLGLVQLGKLDDELKKITPPKTETEAIEAETEEAEDEEDTPTTSMGLWNKTKDKVDAEINRLCDYFRKTREEPCLEAADALAKSMDLFKVDLTSSLMNIDNAQGDQKKQLYPKVCKILDAYKQSVVSDPYLMAADTNPFVPVNSRKPLLTALHQIQKMLQAQIGS